MPPSPFRERYFLRAKITSGPRFDPTNTKRNAKKVTALKTKNRKAEKRKRILLPFPSLRSIKPISRTGINPCFFLFRATDCLPPLSPPVMGKKVIYFLLASLLFFVVLLPLFAANALILWLNIITVAPLSLSSLLLLPTCFSFRTRRTAR